MANNCSFPFLSINDIILFMNEVFPDEQFSEQDFRDPQPSRIQQIYMMLLEATIDLRSDRFAQPQLEASKELMFPELHEDLCPVMNLSIALSRFMVACRVTDFRIKDLLTPKPKRTIRMLSGIINFYRFTGERYESFNRMKQQQQEVLQQHRSYKNRIDELKTRINLIKAQNAEKDVAVAEMAERVDKLSSTMVDSQQEQATLQRDIQHIKTSIAEKTARIDKHKLSSHNTKDAIEKLRPQIIQSPERIKTDMTRMHNAIEAGKAAKEDKARRLQEVRGQQDRGMVLVEASQQGVKLLANIVTELDKQKEMNHQIEKVRDKCQTQKDALRELTVKESHLNRQINSKQEKLSKMTFQHKLEVESTKGSIAERERELSTYEKKEQKKCGEMHKVKDQIKAVKEQMADKENIHTAEMQQMKEGYNNMLEQLDSYHADLAVSWEQNDPRKILTTVT